ncbi:ABC-type multidrug transport system fused ATPase/permease subunit [Chitinophaga skermanii]|uniref:ABC-type multidrug transport system fused ATPase/permease subunit n=1 Tax=Chitinophaga skermanii TaxID=331697 RepID=A0A327QR57_9BACT|nr:ABC transporter transmembrane domain-containing protein [Chitinophaga skermanii]RAJ06731.1 ABC-type multidrug transport system fused ATPase/permease subunit [Chitinophaga skermanii]
MENQQKKQKLSLGGFKKTLRLYKFAKPYRWQFLLGLTLLFLSSASTLLFPKLLGQLVDAAHQDRVMQEINRIGWMLVAVLLAQSTLSFFRIAIFTRVTEKILAVLRQVTYGHLTRLPMKFFAERRVGELNSRISSDISILQDTFTTTLAEFIRQLVMVVGGLTLLLITTPQLTVFMLAILPVIIIVAMVFGKWVRKFSKKVQAQVADSNVIVEETLQGIYNVKAFANEHYEVERYKQKTNEAAKTGILSGTYQGYFASFLIMGLFGTMVAVIWKGAIMINEGQLMAGQLFSFIIYTGFIGGSITGLAEIYTRLQKGLGATENILEILDEPVEELSEVKIEHIAAPISGQIVFENVSFHYPSRKDITVLRDVNFTVQPGWQVALVGPSGAGKSTIVSLLLRLYDPVQGSIKFDGKDALDIPLSELRSQMAVVPQDVYLFGGTIRENIAYGNPEADETAIIEAAKQANAWEFIQNFPSGLDTIVGERGIQLSGGQRQRIAIARAVLKNPRLLILDEATSALDAESERLVQDALDKLMKGRTSIVIAHRLATVRKADLILVMENGTVVESGTHESLLQHDQGLYKTLSTLQFTH